MLYVENRILRLIADGASLEETIGLLCRDVENTLPDIVCAVMIKGAEDRLYPLAAPSLPQALCSRMDGVMIGAECGTDIASREPVSVFDIENDARWATSADLALAAGLRSCWSMPIQDDDGMPVGALTLYFKDRRGPSVREEDVAGTCVDLCQIALRRHGRVVDRERRASFDALTGLPNRAAFNAALAGVSHEEPGSWGLFVVDLDNLKTVNDTFGHSSGDDLIRAAAERISLVMKPDITFRLGGDEFAVLIRNAGALSDLSATADRLLRALDAPASCDGHALVPAATIGGAVSAAGDASAHAVYQNADFALYHAKETGRGGFVRYWAGIDTRIRRRRHAAQDVSAALAGGRIDAFYQPVVRLDTREIVGVEALCRMRTCTGEIVAASAFQEATADATIAVALTSRMLSIIANDIRHWLNAGIPFPRVGFNVSTADLYAGNLLVKLEQSFGSVGVPLGHLALEVNEAINMARPDNVVVREIARLRKSGLCVALDGFGTGYASLTNLVNVPVDAIKIDRSFVARLGARDPSIAIVRGLLDIARELGIWIVAEGIETEDQASLLETLGCKLGQGFAFSHAVHRDAMTILLRRHAVGTGTGILPNSFSEQSARFPVHLRTGTE